MKYVLSGTGFSLVFVFSVIAMAEGFQPEVHGGDGFRESGLPVSTVAAALKMPDDTAVVLEGKIEKRLEKENYLFSDSTGSVTVEIDDDDWRGLTATPSDTLVIKGEVEKESSHTEIDVDSVELKK